MQITASDSFVKNDEMLAALKLTLVNAASCTTSIYLPYKTHSTPVLLHQYMLWVPVINYSWRAATLGPVVAALLITDLITDQEPLSSP